MTNPTRSEKDTRRSREKWGGIVTMERNHKDLKGSLSRIKIISAGCETNWKESKGIKRTQGDISIHPS